MRIISSSVIYKNMSNTGVISLIRILIILCDKFLRFQLNSISTIYLLGGFRGRVGDCGYAILMLR